MPEEAYPILMAEEKLFLRFEDADLEKIESEISMYTAFHPQNMKYRNAAIILWRGLRRETEDGHLVHAIQQNAPGKAMAQKMVKEFCGKMPGMSGLMIMYGSFMKAMVLSGWFGEPENTDQPKKEPTEKN